MFTKKTVSIVAAMTVVIASLSGWAGAQSKEFRGGWVATMPSSEPSSPLTMSRAMNSAPVDSAPASAGISDACEGAEIRKGNNIYSSLVGSWLNTVTITPSSGGPSRQFTTLETFNVGGTMIDEADGPGNVQSIGLGAWAGGIHDSTATFQLFQYDESGSVVGRVRIRGSFHVSREDQLIAPKMTIDFIAPNGSVFCGIASATITGTRIPALTP